MKCLRCGRETANQQVFCDRCLEDMARHPVKPDTAIHLPSRKPKTIQPKPSRRRKKECSAEEMVVILRKRIRALSIALIVLVVLLAGAVAAAYVGWQPEPEDNLGQNYQTVGTAFSGSTGE